MMEKLDAHDNFALGSILVSTHANHAKNLYFFEKNLSKGVYFNIKNEIENLHYELIPLSKDFHVHPKLGFEEIRTSGLNRIYNRAQ